MNDGQGRPGQEPDEAIPFVRRVAPIPRAAALDERLSRRARIVLAILNREAGGRPGAGVPQDLAFLARELDAPAHMIDGDIDMLVELGYVRVEPGVGGQTVLRIYPDGRAAP